MMNANDLKGKTRQMKDWRRRFVALVAALTLLISSCGLTAFAESDEDIYSAPVTAPIAPENTSPAPEDGGAEATPAPENGEETGTEPGEEPGEETGEETGTETEGEPEVSEEPEDLSAYESGTLVAEADGVGVTLDYTPEARIPEGAVLTLARAAGGDLYSAMKSASRVLKEEQNETWQREVGDEAVFYLLTLTNPEGIELHPASGITFTCVNLLIPEGSTGFVTGTESATLDWDTNLTLEYLPEAIGYATLKQVQTGIITLVHNDRDYMVTASYGPEAGFPYGTALKVREIMPGTPEYALYSGMTDEALNEDWSEITLERYFDISFVKGDVELEPQGDVDVQITFRDKIEENEDTEVAAVHIENNEATVIESETDSQKVAKHDDEAIDTVTFTSDSFSVFGVVQKKKIITKLLEAGGQTYEIGVTYTQEAEIPEDAQIKVEEIPEGSDLYNAYKKQTAAALNADDVRLPGLYDISIVDAENNKVEPKVPVSVAIKLLNDENTTEEIQIVHFTEEMPQELVEAEAKPEETPETTEQTTEQTEVQSEPLSEEDKIASETIEAKVEDDNTITFDTQSFSVYAFAYTVDFYYGEYEYHLEGGTYMSLKNLLTILHIVEADQAQEFVNNIESVTFSDPALLSVSKVEEDTTVGELAAKLELAPSYSSRLSEEAIESVNNTEIKAIDWALISLSSFFTEESLTVVMNNGDRHIIRMTDDADFQYKAYVNHQGAGYIDRTGRDTFAGGTYQDIKVDGEGHKLAFVKLNGNSNYGIEAKPKDGFEFAFWYEIKADGTIAKYKDAILTGDPIWYHNGSVFFACFIRKGDKLLVLGDPQPSKYTAWWSASVGTMPAFDEQLGLSRYLINPTNVQNNTDFMDYFSESYKYQFVGWVAEDIYSTRIISRDQHSFTLPSISKNTLLYPKYELKPEYRNSWYVWLDGSDGIGTQDSDNTYYARTDQNAIREGAGQTFIEHPKNTQFVLPTTYEFSAPLFNTAHHYSLQGWYDTAHKKMWAPGTPVTLDCDTVFYACWFPSNYNFASGEGISTADTSSFIHTEVYDYNNMYNMRTLDLDQENSYITSFGHYEQWNLNRSNGEFIFLSTKGHYGSTILPAGIYNSPININDEAGTDNAYYNGRPRSIGVPGDLFNTNIDGVKYVGEGNHLFIYDNNTGYYYYDSAKNAATYDGTKFRVYSNTEVVTEPNSTSDFLPFNGGKNEYSENYGEVDYWFGLRSVIDFYLPDKPGEKITSEKYGNRSTKDDEMVYKFSGDDDVWVLVDGVLVLNMSGIHGPVYGEINFSKGTYTIAQNGTRKTTDSKGIMSYATDGTGTVTTKNLSELLNIDAGDHKLTLVYLERGASQSNCAIYFNLAPRYTLQIQKKDASGQNLGPATFGIYMDEDCTVAANVWGRYTTNTTNIFTTGNDGYVHIAGLLPNMTYYLRELVAPDGYPDISQEVITLTLDSYGNPTTSFTGDSNLVEAQTATNNGEYMIVLKVKNINKTSITAKKVWTTLDGGTTSVDPISVNVKLQRYTLSSSATEDAPDHTVRILTQYYGNQSGAGYATDEHQYLVTYQNSSHKVQEGGSISFDVETSGATAIYSISAKYSGINVSYSKNTNTQAYKVNGAQKDMPQKASVTLTNLSGDNEIYITYIGEAASGTGLNASIKNIETTDGNGQVRAKVQDGTFNSSQSAVPLNEGNDWKHTWNDLESGNGTDTYYYYIIEDNPSTTGISVSNWDTAYVTTYSSNGLSSGTVTVNNTLNAKKAKLRKLATDTNEGLPGAKFLLYTKTAYESNSNPINMNQNTGLLEEVTYNSTDATLQSGSDGYFYTGYIPLGSYVLVEDSAPTGYSRLTHPIEMEITEKYLKYRDYGVADAGWTELPVRNGYFNLDIDNPPIEGTQITVLKNWPVGNIPSGASVSMTLKRYKQVVGGSNPVDPVVTDPPTNPPASNDMTVNVRVTSWKDSNGNTISAPDNGYIWYQIHKGSEILQNSQLNNGINWNESYTVEDVAVGEDYLFNYPAQYLKWENGTGVAYGTARVLSGTYSNDNRNFAGQVGTVDIELEVTLNSSSNAKVILYVANGNQTDRNSNVNKTLYVPHNSTIYLSYSEVIYNTNNHYWPGWQLFYWDTTSNVHYHHWSEVSGKSGNGGTNPISIQIGDEDEYCVLVRLNNDAERNMITYDLSRNTSKYINSTSPESDLGKQADRTNTGSLLDFLFPAAYADGVISLTRSELPATPVAGATWEADTTWELPGLNVSGSNGAMVVTLSGSTWSQTFDVDALDADGNAYLYVLEEVTESGFDITNWDAVITNGIVYGDHETNQNHTGDTLYVTNTYTAPSVGSVELTKVVADGTSVDENKDFNFTFSILDGNHDVNEDINGEYYGFTFTKGTTNFTLKHNQTMEFNNLPSGLAFKIAEEQDELFIQSATRNGDTVPMPIIDVVEENSTIHFITTNTRKESINIQAEKVWNTGSLLPTAVQLTLRRKGDAADYIHSYDPVTVIPDASGKWTYEWTNLLKNYTKWGEDVPYYYFVVETGIFFGSLNPDGTVPADGWVSPSLCLVSGGNLTYDSTKNAYTTTITNTSKIDVPVIKNWDDFSDAAYSWKVGFKLQKKEELVYGSNTIGDDVATNWQDTGDVLEVTKGQQATFGERDVYTTHADGNVYKVTYQAIETWYKVWETANPNGENEPIARWYSDGSESLITNGNKDYVAYISRVAGENVGITEFDERYTIIVDNQPKQNYSDKLVVHKKWLDIFPEDLPYYPAVYVTLYQYDPDKYDIGTSKPYVGQPGDTEVYIHHELKYDADPDKAWTWVISGLPKYNNNNHEYRYFVVEDPLIVTQEYGQSKIPMGRYVQTDNNTCNTDSRYYIKLDSYRASDSYQSGTWNSQGGTSTFGPEEAYYANTGNTGEILVQNRCPSEYMQFDIKKKFLQYRMDTSGVVSLWTTTQETRTMQNMIIEIQIYRRIVADNDPNGDLDYAAHNPDVIKTWTPYANWFRVGYGEDRNDIRIDPNGNPFVIKEEGGTWQFNIKSTNQNSGLPRRGFYTDKDNQTIIPVRYQYLFKETNVYDKNYTPIGYGWSSWLPFLWDPITDTATKVQVFELELAQDDDRILNTPGTSLTVLKDWVGVPPVNVKEIYIKVDRWNPRENKWEDFTYVMSQELEELGGLARDYVGEHPDALDTDNGRLVLKASNNWRVTLNNISVYYPGGGNETPAYKYRIRETGYLDNDGHEYECTEFSPAYYIWDKYQGKLVKDPENNTGMNLLQVDENSHQLMVQNTVPYGSLQIIKVLKNKNVSTPMNTPFTFNVTLTKPSDKTLAETDLIIDGGTFNNDFNLNGNVATFTVTITGEGTATISGIPYGTTYTVEEQTPPAGWIKVGSEEYLDSGKTISTTDKVIDWVKATNTETTEITVDKKWFQANTNKTDDISTSIQDATITVKLTDGTTDVTADASSTAIDPVMLNGSETPKWTYTWTNLPKNYPSGDPIQYQVVETSATVNGTALPGAGVPKTATRDGTTANLFHLENELPTKNIEVTKVWTDGDDNAWPTNIQKVTVGLYRMNGSTAEPYPDQATQKKIDITKDNSKNTFEDLPVYDNNGALITYSIKELSITPTGEGTTAVNVNGDYVTIAGVDSWAVTIVDVDASNKATVTNTRVKTNIDILKVKEKTDETLTGAIFKLEKQNADGETYTVVYGYGEITVDGDGHADINGLTDGTYQLTETKAPDGYNKLSAPIAFTIIKGIVNYTDNTNGLITYKKETGDGVFKIGNTPGSALPATGGSGTLIYTIAGMALIVLAGVLLVSRRRRSEQ